MGRLIGLCGLAGSGKSSVAGILERDHGFTVTAFADPLREMAQAMDPIVGLVGGTNKDVIRYNEAVERYGYTEAKAIFPELRRFLQRLGTEAGRNILGEYLWVMEWEGRNGEAIYLNYPIVVSDVRFENEAHHILALGGEIWRIVRPSVGIVNQHVSETEMADIDADLIIHNGKDLDHLALLVGEALNRAENGVRA